MRFHIKSSSYHHYAYTMLSMPIYNYRNKTAVFFQVQTMTCIDE